MLTPDRKYWFPYLWKTSVQSPGAFLASTKEMLENIPTAPSVFRIKSIFVSILARCTIHSPEGTTLLPTTNPNGTCATIFWLLLNCALARSGSIVSASTNIRVAYFIKHLQELFRLRGSDFDHASKRKERPWSQTEPVSIDLKNRTMA